MQTGPQSEPIYAEPLEDPFKQPRQEPAPAAPKRERVPEKTPA